jgi:hypothetical protein
MREKRSAHIAGGLAAKIRRFEHRLGEVGRRFIKLRLDLKMTDTRPSGPNLSPSADVYVT